MGKESFHHNYRAFIALFKVCAKRKDLQQGIKLHAEIPKQVILENNPYLVSALINMYAKCGAFSKAKQVLEEYQLEILSLGMPLFPDMHNKGMVKKHWIVLERCN